LESQKLEQVERAAVAKFGGQAKELESALGTFEPPGRNPVNGDNRQSPHGRHSNYWTHKNEKYL